MRSLTETIKNKSLQPDTTFKDESEFNNYFLSNNNKQTGYKRFAIHNRCFGKLFSITAPMTDYGLVFRAYKGSKSLLMNVYCCETRFNGEYTTITSSAEKAIIDGCKKIGIDIKCVYDYDRKCTVMVVTVDDKATSSKLLEVFNLILRNVI